VYQVLEVKEAAMRAAARHVRRVATTGTISRPEKAWSTAA